MSQGVAVQIVVDRNLSPLCAQAGLKSIYAVAKAIDEVGNKTKTQVIRSVAKQAGVKYGRAKGVIDSRQAMGAGSGSYSIIARDVTLSLKEFGPRQTKRGVSAAPWGQRWVFPHTFMGPGGHVYVRTGRARLPIHKLFGPNRPKEMVKKETEATFYRVSDQLLGQAIEKWLVKQIG